MIFCKLDWYSAVFERYSIGEIMQKLGIYDEFFADLLIHTFDTDTVFGTTLAFCIEGVNVQIQKAEFEYRMKMYEDGDLQHISGMVLDYINLSISGKGLDFLRQHGFVPELRFRDPAFWIRKEEKVEQRSYHVTRADFAFDWINNNGGAFVNSFIDYLNMSERRGWIDANGRLKNGCPSGLKWSVKHGSTEKTVYLGSTRGDKMLRIYDKFLEQAPTGVPVTPFPSCYGEVKDWLRFELQTRRDFAERCLFASSSLLDEIRNRDILNYIQGYTSDSESLKEWDNDTLSQFVCILGYIGEKFCIREEDGSRILPFFRELFDWERLPSVRAFYILRQKDKIQDDFSRATNFIFGSGSTSLLSLLLILGKERFLEMCQERLNQIFDPTNTLQLSRKKALLARLNSFCISHDCKIEDLPCRFDGRYLYIE